MAFDGIVIANLTRDLKNKLEGGKINKIAQPEKDELLFTIKNNRETLRLALLLGAGRPLGEQVLSALFDAVTPRTAGFNSTDTGALTSGSVLLTIIFMFIGGSPGSTAGGVKTTTVFVILLHALSGVRRERSANAFGRSIGDDTLKKATAVLYTNLLLALVGAVAICAIQPLGLTEVLFETFSAIGTAGMTTGITRSLLPVSQAVIIFLMYCGRVGSISFAVALLEKRALPPVTLPQEEITIG